MAPRPEAGQEYVLTLTCPEAPGIVFAVSRFVMEHGGNISASQQFDDRLTDTFFMRVQFRADSADVDTLRRDFAGVATEFGMAWQVHDMATPTRTLLMVSKFGHCLNDLLFRTTTGALNIEVPLIVSNHRDFEAQVLARAIRWHSEHRVLLGTGNRTVVFR
jgi:formyltetrahydrofolate deformylase